MFFLFHCSHVLIDSNIPKSNILLFYSALVGEFLSIVRTSLLYNYFNEEAKELLNRIKSQGAHSLRCKKALSKIIRRHEKVLANFE